MLNNQDILNVVLNNGVEFIIANVSMDKIEDEGLKAMINEYLDLRKRMVQYIISAVAPKQETEQIELDLK